MLRPVQPIVDIGAVEVSPLLVTINQASGQADPVNAGPINFTVVFSSPVTGFSNPGVSLAGSTANISAATIAITGGGDTYNVAVDNVTGSGAVQASVLISAATDGSGEGNEPSTSTDNTVTIDTVHPTVTINQASGQPDPATAFPINFTVVFSEPVTSFTNANISLAGSSANVSSATIAVTGGGPTYNVAVRNVIGSGTVRKHCFRRHRKWQHRFHQYRQYCHNKCTDGDDKSGGRASRSSNYRTDQLYRFVQRICERFFEQRYFAGRFVGECIVCNYDSHGQWSNL